MDASELSKYDGKLVEAVVYRRDNPQSSPYSECEEGFVHNGIFYHIAFPSLTLDGYGVELLPRRANHLKKVTDSKYPTDLKRKVMESFIQRGETKVELSLPVRLPVFDSLSREIRANLRKK